MIDYYTAKTLGGNARKISIVLAEAALDHVVHFVDLARDTQKESWFLEINPNGRIPAIRDSDVDGLTLGESGAILVYLAEKCGKFLSSSEPLRSRTLQWVFWQTSGVGPMFGEWTYFARNAPEKIEAAIARFRDESTRLMGVLDRQLSDNEYVVGQYSIADMALYSWIKPAFAVFERIDHERASGWHGTSRWLRTMAERPAVSIAMTRYEGTALRIARDADAV